MKRKLYLYLFIACALMGRAQSLVINQSLELVAMSSAVSQYNNQFGRFNNPDLDEPFPYAVICMNLSGDVRAAKEVINLDLGTMLMVQSTHRDIDNTILFLVPVSAKNIYLTCGDGCSRQLLWNQGKMQSNKVYTCEVEFAMGERSLSENNDKLELIMKQLAAMQQTGPQDKLLPDWALHPDRGEFIGVSFPGLTSKHAVALAQLSYIIGHSVECDDYDLNTMSQRYEKKNESGSSSTAIIKFSYKGEIQYDIHRRKSLENDEYVVAIKDGKTYKDSVSILLQQWTQEEIKNKKIISMSNNVKLLITSSYTRLWIELSQEEKKHYRLMVSAEGRFDKQGYVSTENVVPISEQFYIAMMEFFRLTTTYISPQNATRREATPILEYKKLNDSEIRAIGL